MFVCVFCATLVKTTCTLSFLQVLSASEYDRRWTVSRVAGDLYRSEGLAGFARGMGARIVTMSVGSSISWFTYEVVKRQLGAAYEDEEERL